MENMENAQLLLNYCARGLESEQETWLKGHLAECRACREFVRGHGAVWTALDAWEAPPVSADFDRRLYRRISAQVPWWDVLLRPRRWRTLAAAAAACVMLTAGILLEQATVSPVPMPGDVAQTDSVQPEQVERTLDALEMLNEFNHHVRSDRPDSKL